MLALDEFVLWVNADKPYKTAKDYIDALKKAPPGSMKMGGTGSKQEDQIITVAIEKATEAKLPTSLTRAAAKSRFSWSAITSISTVNNPIEAVAQWRGGKLRPLCVFDGKPMAYDDKIADGKAGAIFRPASRKVSTSNI